MRLVSAISVKEPVPIVLFANGRRDERIFRGIASKYNHKKTLLSPQIPRVTGLAILETFARLVEMTEVTVFVIIIDREHIREEERLLYWLNGYGFKARIVSKRNSLLKMICERGPKSVVLYIVLLGYTEKGNIEENLSELIKLISGEEVKPDKVSIASWLKKKRMRDVDVVMRASKSQLEKAFQPIIDLLRELERNNST